MTGVACFVRDNARRSYFIRVFDIDRDAGSVSPSACVATPVTLFLRAGQRLHVATGVVHDVRVQGIAPLFPYF